MRIRSIRNAISRNVFIMLSFTVFISAGYAILSDTIHISGTATSAPYVSGQKLLIETNALNSPNYTSGNIPTGYSYQSETLTENNLYTYLKVNVSTTEDLYSSTQTRSFKLSNTYSEALMQGSIAIQSQQNTNFLNVTNLSCNVTAGSGGDDFVCPAGYTCSDCPSCVEDLPCAAGHYCAYDGASQMCPNPGCVECPLGDGFCDITSVCPPNFRCEDMNGHCEKCSDLEICPSTPECLSGYQYINIFDPTSSDKFSSGNLMWLNDTNFNLFKPTNLINKYEDFKPTQMAVSDTVNPGDNVTCDVTYYTNPYGHTAAVGNITSVVKLSYQVGGTTQNYYYNLVLVP